MLVKRFALVLSATLALSAFPVAAQSTGTLNLTIAATLNPVLQGSDPQKLAGRPDLLLLSVSETLTPISTTSNSATYALPAGALTVTQTGVPLASLGGSTLTVQLTDTADILTIAYSVTAAVTNTFTGYLAPGSWTSEVLTHLEPFSPSSQSLTSATTAGGPGSQSSYVYQGATTVLGLNGTASNGDLGLTTSMYGDNDCFGLPNVTACPDGSLWETGLGGVFFTDYRDPTEKAENSVTDIWAAPANIHWNQPSYSTAGAVSASLRIRLAGIADVGQTYKVVLNGKSIGTIHRNNNNNNYQQVVTYLFNIPVAMLNGNDQVTINTSGADGFIMDYSQLTLVLGQ